MDRAVHLIRWLKLFVFINSFPDVQIRGRHVLFGISSCNIDSVHLFVNLFIIID